MNIEEAVKELTEIKELVEEDLKYKDYNVTAVLDQIDLESLVVVLNELDKNTEIISDLQNEVTIKDAEIERLKEYEYMYKDLCN